jgi:hypothetical protein
MRMGIGIGGLLRRYYDRDRYDRRDDWDRDRDYRERERDREHEHERERENRKEPDVHEEPRKFWVGGWRNLTDGNASMPPKPYTTAAYALV